MAHAIHDMIADVCGTNPFRLCDKLRPAPPGVDLLTYIRNVSFTGKGLKKSLERLLEIAIVFFFCLKGPQGTEIKFNKDGDAFGSYNIYQYQHKEDKKYDYVHIGNWKEV
jgi:hypothetical protein